MEDSIKKKLLLLLMLTLMLSACRERINFDEVNQKTQFNLDDVVTEKESYFNKMYDYREKMLEGTDIVPYLNSFSFNSYTENNSDYSSDFTSARVSNTIDDYQDTINFSIGANVYSMPDERTEKLNPKFNVPIEVFSDITGVGYEGLREDIVNKSSENFESGIFDSFDLLNTDTTYGDTNKFITFNDEISYINYQNRTQ